MAPPVAIDPKGPAATEIGRTLTGSGAQSYVLLDGHDAASWRGDAGDADVELEESGRALRCDAGGAGAAGVYAIGDGLALVEYFPDESIDWPHTPAVRSKLGLRVAQLPARGKVERLGTIEIKSGCLAVLPTYGDGSPIAPREVAAAAKGGKVKNLGEGDLGLVPLRAGRYDVFRERLKASEAGLGELDTRIRVVRAGPAKAAKAAPATKAAKTKAAPATKAAKTKAAPAAAKAAPRAKPVLLEQAEPPELVTLMDWKDAPEYHREDDFIAAAVASGRKKLGFELQGRRRRMVICSVGRSTLTAVWPVAGGVALVELTLARGAASDPAGLRAALGGAIEQAPPASKAKTLGKLSVRGGGIVAFHADQAIARAQAAPVSAIKALRRGGAAIGCLVPLEPGTYLVTSDLLNAKRKLGTAGRRVRIVKKA